MEIKKTSLNQIEIFEIFGRIDADNSKEFENVLIQSFEDGVTKMLIDLTNLEYISSSGLRVFLCIAKKIGKNGFIYLCSLQPQVTRIFGISGFNSIFTVFENREDAIKKSQ